MGKIILASSSPRRREILERAGYRFRVIPSPYEETNTRTVFSLDYIEDLAYQKAKAVEGDVVIGADTMVVLEGRIFGKPSDASDARRMLRELSGKTHEVVTAIAVIAGGKARKNSTVSRVTFEYLTEEQICRYVEEFKPFDKAGAYGIQELPNGYIKSYEGSLENIIGLCPKALAQLF